MLTLLVVLVKFYHFGDGLVVYCQQSVGAVLLCFIAKQQSIIETLRYRDGAALKFLTDDAPLLDTDCEAVVPRFRSN